MADVTSVLRLVVDSTGTDRAGRRIKTMRKDARQLESAFRAVGAALGAAFSGAQISRSIELFNEQARAVAKVEQAIKSTSSAAGFSAQELQKVASQLQNISLFGDEDILNNVTAQLLTFTNIANKEFLRTQKVALDLATVLDGDLKSASIQLGKALNDPIANLSALSRSGIQFSDAQKELIKSLAETNQLAEAQSVILDELERQYGGQAEAAAAVGAGAFKQLGNVLGDIQELVGSEIVQAFNPLIIKLRDFLSVAENQEKVVTALKAVAAGLVAIAAPAVISGIGFVATTMLGLTAPILAVGAAVAGLVAFKDGIAEWAFGIADAGAVVQATFQVLDEKTQAIRARIVEFAISSRAAFAQFANAATDAVNGLRDRFANIIPSQAVDGVKNWASRVLDVVERLAKAIAEIIGDAFLAPLRLVRKGFEAIGNIDLLPDRLQRQIQSTTDALDSFIETVDSRSGAETIDRFTEAARAGIDSIRSIGQATVETYEEIKIRAVEISEQSKSADDGLKQAASQAKNLAKETAVAAKNTAKIATESEKARAALEQNQADQRFLIEAARQGERELRIAEEVLRIRRQIKDISVEEARVLAEQNVALDRQLEIIREQNAALDGIFDELLGDAKDLWRLFFDDGRDAINGIQSLLKDLFSGKGFNFGDIFTGSDGLIVNLQDGFKNFVSSTLADTPEGQRRQQAFGNFVATQSRDFLPNNGAANDNTVSALNNVADQIASLSGEGALYIGAGRLGLGLADAIDGNGTNQTTASAAQFLPALGSFFGPLGTLAGVFGSIGAGLFSKQSSNGARVFLDQDGNVAGTFAKDKGRGDANLATLEDFAGGLQTIVGTLESIVGGSAGSIASNFQLDDRAGLQLINRNQRNNVIRTFGNDIDAAIEFIFDRALSGFRGGNQDLLDLARAFSAAGVGVEQTLNSLTQIAALTKDTTAPVGEFAQAVEEINRVFDDAIESAGNVALAAEKLNEARATQIGLLKEEFDLGIRQQLLQQTDPLLGTFEQLSKQFEELISNANALGSSIAPGSNVARLITEQLEDVFAAALNDGTGVEELRDRLDDLSEVLAEAGVNAQFASTALDRAIADQRVLFDDQLQSDIGQFINGPTDELKSLLKAQKERLQTAEELGANLNDVARLTALELQDFFSGLSDGALQEVESFLGLFEEASASVAQQLDFSQQDLRNRADQFGQFAQDFASLSKQFDERFIAASPAESLDILRARASDLLGQVGQGNASAAQALPQVLQQLVDNARTLGGNSPIFTEVLAFAQETLSAAEASALLIQSDAEKQLSAIGTGNEILADIREILSSAGASNALFSSFSSGGIATSEELLAAIQTGAGLTPANDNSNPLSINNLISASIAPILAPINASLATFTEGLTGLSQEQAFTTAAIDESAASITNSIAELRDVELRKETLLKQMLQELEELNAA